MLTKDSIIFDNSVAIETEKNELKLLRIVSLVPFRVNQGRTPWQKFPKD